MPDFSAYLQRIHYDGPLQPNFETLKALHRAHLCAVPFENLDIALKRPIVLDLEFLFAKIVIKKRGGFCYELNGLFAALLSALGYEITYLSASDAHDSSNYGPEFDHLTLLVRAPGMSAVLADVGWGDTFREPLLADKTEEQLQNGRAYWLEPQDEYRILWQRDSNGASERQYRFTFRPRAYSEFEGMCQYHQTSPDSPFTQKRICTLATPEGRITLTDSRLITTINGQRHEEPIASEQEYLHLLQTRFDIILSE
jgi:N-hydroxyarylamine O-acetyltransferase